MKRRMSKCSSGPFPSSIQVANRRAMPGAYSEPLEPKPLNIQPPTSIGPMSGSLRLKIGRTPASCAMISKSAPPNLVAIRRKRSKPASLGSISSRSHS